MQKDQHLGETAWLFGKGQSLDVFDFSVMDASGGVPCALTHAATYVPGVRYRFSWRDDCFVLPEIEGCTDYVGHAEETVSQLNQWSPRELPHFFRTGTGEYAVSVLIYLGFREIRLVGFDCVGHHATCFNQPELSGINYDKAVNRRNLIRHNMQACAAKAGVKIYDELITFQEASV